MQPILPIESFLYNTTRFVCAIYAEFNPKFRKPGVEQIGTGVLFKDESGGYLITAKHVIDTLPSEKIIIAGPDNLIAVNGTHIYYKTEIDYDLYIIKIHDDLIAILEKYYIFSQPGDIKSLDRLSDGGLLLWVGYPNSQNKSPYNPTSKIEAKAFYVACNEIIDFDTLKMKQKNSNAHFAMFFDTKKAFMYNTEAKSNFGFKGMSGGGIWELTLDEEKVNVTQRKLVGIGIEFIEGKKLIIGTKILSAVYALESVKKNF